MLGVPSNRDSWQRDFGNLVRDKGSSDLKHPGGYMFKDLPEVDALIADLGWPRERILLMPQASSRGAL